MPTKRFNGIIKLDVRDSKPDWTPYMAPRVDPAKWTDGKKPPNVLFVLFDDTGLAAWSPFGGGIKMPTLDNIAKNGLIYTQWHTAALCSPTRGMLLTGRNHHLNGNACITEGANGFPGQHARLPDECATIAQILQDNGWSTFWVGKNHNVPETDIAAGSTRSQWPLAKGFDRFYGFIGGETNQWYPDLVVDNHLVELPEGHEPGYEDENGYHLSKDLSDEAIQMIKDQKASNPSKPWYMWFCPGANHAPHHAPKKYIEKYLRQPAEGEDSFDFRLGYEKYREWALPRMIERGIVPPMTALSPINPMAGKTNEAGDLMENEGDRVLLWDELGMDKDGNIDTEKRAQQQELFARMMAVYAAFSEYTDEQVGRIVKYLADTDQLENTVIVWAADNGASGEGSPNGSVNENKFFNNYPDELSENMLLKDELGGPNTYEHFPTGWAMATSTPFKMFKRYSEYAGGTCDPLVISWPEGIKVDSDPLKNIRHQYHHATDIVPTIMDICRVEMPMYYKGVVQYPLSGVSMAYTFNDPHKEGQKPLHDLDAQTSKQRQYYAMLGTRGIWEDGWKAASVHAPISGKGHFDKDKWELYHVAMDRSESVDLMTAPPAYLATHRYDPEMLRTKLQHLINIWFEEAGRNMVLPLDDRSAAEQTGTERPTEEPLRKVYTYYPGAAPVPESVAANVRGRSYTIVADVEITAESKGVIFAHGSRFGGHSLFIKDTPLVPPAAWKSSAGEVYLYYVYNFLGIKPEQKFASGPLTPGRYLFRVEFTKQEVGEYGESIGYTQLFVNKFDDNPLDRRTVVAEGSMNAQVGKFTLCGDGLCVGFDSADAVSEEYSGANPFEHGTIRKVVIIPGKEDVSLPDRVLAGPYSAD